MIVQTKRALAVSALSLAIVTLSAPGRAADLHSTAASTLVLQPAAHSENVDLLQPVAPDALAPAQNSEATSTTEQGDAEQAPVLPIDIDRALGGEDGDSDSESARTIAAIQQLLDASSTGAP